MVDDGNSMSFSLDNMEEGKVPVVRRRARSLRPWSTVTGTDTV